MSVRRRQLVSGAISLLVHATLLLGGGRLLAQAPEYGIEVGTGGIEVHLVAAPSAIKGAAIPVPTPVSAEEDADLVAPTPERPKAPSPEVGDGSSPVPGRDSTTLHAEGGGQTSAQPSYLKNPVPPYPIESRRAGHEGLVVLAVRIDRQGRAEHVELIEGSGHGLLDASALATVRRWKFRPARLGGVPVPSVVEVPIRFTLNSSHATVRSP